MTLAQSPTRRPAWLVVLSLLMLMQSGVSLKFALTNLRDPTHLAAISLGEATATSEQMEVKQQVLTIIKGVLIEHSRAIKGVDVAAIVLALVTLYAVAAILSRDKNGRRLALVTAWLIVAYQLGSLPILLGIARDLATHSAPLLVELVGANSSADERVHLAQNITWFMKAEPCVFSAFGIGWALLLVAYFGGRRGRQLYGLEPTSGKLH